MSGLCRFRRYLVAVSLLLSVVWLPAASAEVAVPANGASSIDQLATRIDALVEAAVPSDELAEELRKRLLELYQGAKRHLEAAREHATRASNLERLPETAPPQVQALRDEVTAWKAGKRVLEEEALDAETPAADLEQRLLRHQAELARLRGQAEELRAAWEQAEKRPLQARDELAEARRKLDESNRELNTPAPPALEPRLAEAQRLLLESRRRARAAEIKALEQELASGDLQRQLIGAETELITLRITHAEEEVKRLQEALVESRRREAQTVRADAEKARRAAAGKHPAISALSKQNADYSRELTEAVEGRTLVAQDREALSKQIAQMERDASAAEQKLQVAGLSEALGQVLRDQRIRLPDRRSYEKLARQREARIGALALRKIQIDERISELADLEAVVDRVVAAATQEGQDPLSPEVSQELRVLLQDQLGLLQELNAAIGGYVRELVELDYEARQLQTQAEVYAEFLDERLLWIRSARPLDLETWRELSAAMFWLLDPHNWYDAVSALWGELADAPVETLTVVLLALGLWRRRRALREMEQTLSRKLHKPRTDRFWYTGLTLGGALLLGLPVPLLVGYAGWQLNGALAVGDFPPALGAGLLATSVSLFIVLVLLHLIRPKGMCELHLRWNAEFLQLLRRYVPAFALLVIPASFLIVLTGAQSNLSLQNSLGRVIFMIAMLGSVAYLKRFFWSRKGVVAIVCSLHPEGWVSRLRLLWGWLPVAMPLVLAVIAAIGYYYTATQLLFAMRESARLLLGLLLLQSLIERGFLVEKRRLLFAQILERRQAAGQAQHQDNRTPQGTELVSQEEALEAELDLSKISEQTRRLVHTLFGWTLVIGLWIIWADVLPALKVLDQTVLWNYPVTEDGQEKLAAASLADLGLLGVIAALVTAAARNLPGVLEMAVLQRLPITAGSRYAIKTIIQYLIVGAGLVYMFQILGLRWSQIQWLVAALGVGLGFGLQEIFANFISGLIILFERPVRVGDTVTVGDVTGVVTRVRIRATTIRDWDRKELIVPNKSFITERVINWTLSDPVTRLVIKVGVAYGTDVNLARDVIMQVVRANPLVMEDPKPTLYFEQFGDSSLNLVLRAYVQELDHRLPVTHELHLAIIEALHKHEITIPFPQRDIHVHREHRTGHPT